MEYDLNNNVDFIRIYSEVFSVLEEYAKSTEVSYIAWWLPDEVTQVDEGTM